MLPFIETRSGKDFWPLDPRPADVDIQDIAHALSNQCRFSGHTKRHYSVAEHSIRVSELLEEWGCTPEAQLWGLLHDASEAYLVDLPTPLKRDPRFAFYLEAESRLQATICNAFGLPIEEPAEVRAADGVMLATEARDLMAYRPGHWTKLEHAPTPYAIGLDRRAWGPVVSKRRFLMHFYRLMHRDTDPVDEYSAPDSVPTLQPTGSE